MFEAQPGSHKKHWKRFTDAVIQVVSVKSDPVFLLWGEKAQSREDLIRRSAGSGAKIIRSSHPSPRSAHRSCGDSPPFIGSRPFSKTNELLCKSGRSKIDWTLGPCTFPPCEGTKIA